MILEGRHHSLPPLSSVTIREVRPGDDDAIAELLDGLDDESRYRRWFTGGADIRRAIDWAAHPEQCSAVGLLALAGDQAVGHAALVPATDGLGEVAFEVAAPWRQHGIATALLTRLVTEAATRGMRGIYADVMPENSQMLAVMREHGLHTEAWRDGMLVLTVMVDQDSSSSLWSKA